MVFIVTIWNESRAMIINFIILLLVVVIVDGGKLKAQKNELSAKCVVFISYEREEESSRNKSDRESQRQAIRLEDEGNSGVGANTS